MWLFGNQFSGSIPPEIGGLTSLVELFLGENDLTGRIPAELGGLSSLEALNLHENLLWGEIPPSIGDLSSLVRLIFRDNKLRGSIPSTFTALTFLEFFDVTGAEMCLTGFEYVSHVTEVRGTDCEDNDWFVIPLPDNKGAVIFNL